ncbi:DUF5359 family protein [Alkalihalobacillus sp. CinArs1]|uniref:DUF5359 family protein n=1 Tax=Alkalihalobacillus sp. CinArs1 TaxID=2995314 RepID=UPI0022DDE0F9|nr:DUF5359 family protein [Alkalihalobacillus sp. CinArs1]
MGKVERLLIKLVVIQFAFLLIAQTLLTHEPFRIYLSKTLYYEGVVNGEQMPSKRQ